MTQGVERGWIGLVDEVVVLDQNIPYAWDFRKLSQIPVPSCSKKYTILFF
jgi:hypothetical protein